MCSIFTSRKRSLRRLCFYRCLSVHGGRAWQGGHAWQGAHVWQGGHAWQGACIAGGCAWWGHVCHTCPAQQMLWNMVNEREVRILLECILVCYQPQRSCGQGYVFTRVCDSVHRGGLRAERTPPGRENPPEQGDPPGQGEPPTPWAGRPPGIRSVSGRNASYWNAFLFNFHLEYIAYFQSFK